MRFGTARAKKSTGTILYIAMLSILLLLVLFTSAQAATYWDESFETGLSNWNNGECPHVPDGCNAAISTDIASQGAKSLKGTYTSNCGMALQGHNGCGVGYDRAIPLTEDLYTRMYYRTSGFTYDGIGTKHFYMRTNGLAPDFFLANMFGSREMIIDAQIVAEVCPTSGTGPYDSCNYYANVGSRPLNDDQWYCIESHIKMNTPGVANGILELWVDGVRTVYYPAQQLRGPNVSNPNQNSSQAIFTSIVHYTQHGLGIKYMDRIAAGNTRIGCGATTDTTPPSPPSKLVVQ